MDIPPGILYLKTGLQCVPIFNDTPHHQRVHKDQKLGSVRPLSDASVDPESVAVSALAESPIGNVSDPDWTESALADVFKLDNTSLSAQQKSSLISFLLRFPDVISHGDHDVGTATSVRHHIELTDPRPVALPVRRLSPQILKEVNQACQELEENNIIRTSDSPFSAPIVPIRKPDGKLRLCIDYRQLNKVTKKDKFPIPNLTDLVYSLHGVKYFSSIDLVRGYYQVLMDEESIEKTAFSTPHAHYEFLRMIK